MSERPVERLRFTVKRGALFVEREGDFPRLIGQAPRGAVEGSTTIVVPVRTDAEIVSAARDVEYLASAARPGACLSCGDSAERGLLCDFCARRDPPKAVGGRLALVPTKE